MSIELLPEYIEKIDTLSDNEAELHVFISSIEQELLPEYVAIVLEAFPLDRRLNLWKLFSGDFQKNIFLEMKNESQQMLLNAMDDDACYPLLDRLDANTLLELTDNLSERFVEYAVNKMTAKQQEHFKNAQDYSDEEVGRWQNFDQKKYLKN